MRVRILQSLSIAMAMSATACAPNSRRLTIATAEPRADDVSSIDGLMRAFYEVVNIAPDAPRQWSRDRTLYSPWLRFVALGESPSGRPKVQIWTHDELVTATEPLIQRGFREREIHRITRRYGAMAHVDSTYETDIGDDHQRSRGVNSLELYFDGHRWWIASAMWESEDAEHPIPAELLPAGATTPSR